MGVVLLIIFAALVIIAVYVVSDEVTAWLDERSSTRKKEAVISRLLEKHQQIQSDYRKAKREMNRAAGQEWRNPFD